MEDPRRSARNQIFQELRPICVKLSQLALKSDNNPQGFNLLINTTDDLYQILNDDCLSNPAFDEKLADYVFFPLSHVLRSYEKHPSHLSEIATKCVRILLQSGWKTLAVDLTHQLLILLTLFSGGSPSYKPSEELQIEAYKTLDAFFKLHNKSPKGSSSLLELPVLPSLGQCLTTILDGIVDGPSSESQLAALAALRALWLCIKDAQTLSNFFPGAVSALTKCLSPSIKTPRTSKVLISALDVLSEVLRTTFGDLNLRNVKQDSPENKGQTLTKSWVSATSSQIKLAIANVVKLHSHKNIKVRQALRSTCLILLDECQTSLAAASSILIETIMILTDPETDLISPSNITTLSNLALIYPAIADAIKTIAYGWALSLPRIMHSNDENAKQSALRRLTNAHSLLSELNMVSMVLDESFGDSLRDSISILFESGYSSKVQLAPLEDTIDGSAQLTTAKFEPNKEYHQLLMQHESQLQLRKSFEKLISNLAPEKQLALASDMLTFLRDASGNSQLSAFWLSFNLVKAASKRDLEFESIAGQIDLSENNSEKITSELYDYSTYILIDSDEDVDWRLQALAMEVVAFTAQTAGEDFRPDLVDVLFPVVQLLGSSDRRLQEHAITTLNLLAAACSYESSSSMIVENVDYLVNSISLKLNTFDISPQAPQVLIMMIKLSGPTLLPYLDDVTGSIFAALDNFHGYPRLVNSLFSVLQSIVNESIKSTQLQITSGPNLDHRLVRPRGPAIEDILSLLKRKNEKFMARRGPQQNDFPREPWKDASSLLNEDQDSQPKEEKAEELQKLPLPKVYTMVLDITRLGQHYLTNQSPILRRKLLELISTACEGLSGDDTEFLPLINDIWPVVVRRLYDEEAFVATAAAATIGQIFKRTGNFMSTRLSVEWHTWMEHARSRKVKANLEKKGPHNRGIYSESWQLWESWVTLLVTALEYVRIDDQMFDELLEVLEEEVIRRKDVRSSFNLVNGDAVWLICCKHGIEVDWKTPAYDDQEFPAILEIRGA